MHTHNLNDSGFIIIKHKKMCITTFYQHFWCCQVSQVLGLGVQILKFEKWQLFNWLHWDDLVSPLTEQWPEWVASRVYILVLWTQFIKGWHLFVNRRNHWLCPSFTLSFSPSIKTWWIQKVRSLLFSVVPLLYLSLCICIALLLRPAILPLGSIDQGVLTLEIFLSCRSSFCLVILT